MAQEFLPLCDVLFNIISLASYFCDVVFDVVTVYTLYLHQQFVWFCLSLACILISMIISQIISIKWYMKKKVPHDLRFIFVVAMHILQCGVLWRYFKLFMPVDLATVKTEVRDLCMLRLVHAFCEAAPMLLIQVYLIWLKASVSDLTDLNIVSTVLSLCSVCWALASFNKNVRRKNIHKLVLTWLGVIFQFLWRIGTVSSRVVVLTVYATLYHYWVFVVIGLHWLSMLLWLISPKNVFHGENMSVVKKMGYSIIIAYVYIFCYINLQEVNARQKMIAFYLTMFLENTLLMAVWLGLRGEIKWFHKPVIITVWGGFVLGIIFMILYYSFFHIRRLKHGLNVASNIGSECTCPVNLCAEHSARTSSYFLSEASASDHVTQHTNVPYCESAPIFHTPNQTFQNGMVTSIPGVFNCRLNPALKRKKKKPSSFIPPPSTVATLDTNGKFPSQFWKRPPPKSVGSDHESSVGSRVNIQQKLQEKKQQQLQELKEIEEEIKQGKLTRPHPLEFGDQNTFCQPIPRSKKQPWVRAEPGFSNELQVQCPGSQPANAGTRLKAKLRSQTPEILLAPHRLESRRIYYDYQEPRTMYSIATTMNANPPSDLSSSSDISGISKSKVPVRTRNRGNHAREQREHQVSMYKSYRIPSDLDSQISLPRSYTLPREFRYYRRPKPRKPIRTDYFVTSNNSSDGDVDSADENDSPRAFPNNTRSGAHSRLRPYPLPHRGAGFCQLHETKL